MSSATKENAAAMPSTPRTAADENAQAGASAGADADFDRVFGSPASATLMLSPPPEEELRYMRRPNEPSPASKPLAASVRPNQPSAEAASSKRKRTVTHLAKDASPAPDPAQPLHTPNPRLRKQVRHAGLSPSPAPPAVSAAFPGDAHARGGPSRMQHDDDDDAQMASPTRKGKSRGAPRLLVPQSPHAENPRADYIPPAHLAASPVGGKARRRSVTPIPPYEPPPERYTPPREIMGTPLAERKPARRAAAAARKKRVSGKGEKAGLQLRVKAEPPEIDLKSPIPPASPSEDPILLVGPPPVVRVHRPSASPQKKKKDDPASLVDFEMDLDFPENEGRPAPRAAAAPDTSSPLRSESSIPPVFDFTGIGDDAGAGAGGWSDSSSDNDFAPVVNDAAFVGGSGALDDGWSDSEDDNDEGEASIGEGDFTGKFLAYKVPIKMDPPTGAARERMEEWGRPISPHPKRLSLDGKGSIADEDIEDDDDDVRSAGKNTDLGEAERLKADGADSESDEEHENEEQTRPSYENKRGRRLTLSEMEELKFGPRKESSLVRDEQGVLGNRQEEQDIHVERDNSMEQQDESIEQEEDSMETDASQQNIFLDKRPERLFDDEPELIIELEEDDKSILVDQEVNEDSVNHGHSSGESFDLVEDSLHNEPNDEDISAAQDDEQMSPHDRIETGEQLQTSKQASSNRFEETTERNPFAPDSPAPQEDNLAESDTDVVASDGGESDSGEGESDLSVVKIMSDDPMAAARAAAILKMHDYDMVARRLRRRQTAAAKVSKPYSTPQKLWRRRTIAGLAGEEHLTANVALLDRATEELRSSPARSRSGSVASSVAGTPTKNRQYQYELPIVSGPRDWTKADWKLLDSCFTDERYELAQERGLAGESLAPVDDVSLSDVAERFTDLMGGIEIVDSHGPSWTQEKILSRARALCKRQRSGQGAPPTPDVSSRFSTPSRRSTPSRFSTLSPTSSMIVPDFTPIANERVRLFDTTDSLSKMASLPPPSSEPFFKVPYAPSTMPARHSRLREEVTSSAPGTPEAKTALGLFGFETPTREQQDDDSDDESVAFEIETMLTPNTARMRERETRERETRERSMSAVKRSMKFIGSWLKPGMFKKEEKRLGPLVPGLPVPPPDVLNKLRPPVETPAKQPPPKIPHPKEQVELQPAPLPQPTKIPRKTKPQRLIELQHVPTPPPKPVEKTASRRSSTSSVRDLVKEFEQKDKGDIRAVPPRVAELRRMGSVGSLKAKGKPTWKP
ncbi:hypothetical protein DFH11DRAFT_1777890 [Phellopilus nigrolimitatus]|nr:hypothetical protein DFH11DRAFT_1777890 [Phellopilus nigrolimitatus]